MSTYDMIIEKGIEKGASTEKNTNICNAHKSGVSIEIIMNIFKVEKAYIMKVLKENKLS